MTTRQRTRRRERIGIEDAADLLGVERQTIRRFITTGRLPAYRVGDKIIRVNRADVEALLVPVTD